jgi:hypothetical protein
MGKDTEGEFFVNIGWAARDPCSVTWNLDTNSAFAVRTEENNGKTLIELAGRRIFRMRTDF